MTFFIISTLLAASGCLIKFKNRNSLYFLTLIFFALMGFFVIPAEGSDLFRHYEMLDFMRRNSLQDSFLQYYWQNTQPLFILYFYLVSRLPANEFLLSFAYICVYGCQFAILSMASKDFPLGTRARKLSFVFIIFTTNAYALTGIRNMMAFSVAALFLYLELVRNKYHILAIFVYAALCLFHDSSVVVLAMRIAFIFIQHKHLRWMTGLFLLWKAFIPLVLKISSIFNLEFLGKVAYKLESYASPDAAHFVSGFGNISIYYLEALLVILVFISFLIRKLPDNIGKYRGFISILAAFCLGGIGIKPVTVRYLPLCLYMLVPCFALSYETFPLRFHSESRLLKASAFTLQFFAAAVLLVYFLFLTRYQYIYFNFSFG